MNDLIDTAAPADFVTAHISLGSNMGDSASLLQAALAGIAALPAVTVRAVSPAYRTEPQGLKGQPFFLNRVAELACPADADPEQLLEYLLTLEQRLGRRREGEARFGPRSIDLDLLLFGNKVMKSRRLILPHPRMLERAFVLVPLADIAPGLCLPQGISVAQALERLTYRRIGDTIYQNYCPADAPSAALRQPC